jgi:hypothetical protein
MENALEFAQHVLDTLELGASPTDPGRHRVRAACPREQPTPPRSHTYLPHQVNFPAMMCSPGQPASGEPERWAGNETEIM